MISPGLHPREDERLALLKRCGILDTAPEPAFDELVELASSLAGVPIGLVSLIDSHRQWFKGRHGLNATETPRDLAFCAHAILDHDHTLIVEDARLDPRFCDNPLVVEAPHVVFYAGVPLRVGADRLPLGTLCVIGHQPHQLSSQVLRQLTILARQVELLLEARLRQRDLEEALIAKARGEQRESLLTKVAEQIPGMVYQFVLQPDGTSRFPYSSAGILGVYGLTPQEAERSDAPVIERIHIDDRERAIASITASAQTLSLWNCEYRYLHPDGRLLWLQGRAIPESCPDGSILWHGFITDISERKKSDQHIQDLTAQQRQQAELIKLANITAGIGMWIFNVPSGLLRWDDRMLEIYGYTAKEFTGAYGDWRRRVHPEDLDRMDAQVNDCYTHKTPLRATFRLLMPDGTLRHISSSAGINANAAGDITDMVGVNLDITDQVTRENRLHQALMDLEDSALVAIIAREAAEAAGQAKAEFLANMSHEIRTPMNGVIGMTSLLLSTHLTSEQRDFVDSIRVSGDALLTIINDILDFSKIEAGKLDIDPMPFDLRCTCEDVIELLAQKAVDKGLDLLLDYPAHITSRVIGDEGRIRQILLNLTGNALKFTAQGTVIVRVEALLQAEHQVTMRLSVTDTGMGLTPEQLGRLFQAFSQADASTSRRFGGTGLGLAISARLCALMNGTISATSTIGVGSSFVADLPMAIADGSLIDDPARAKRSTGNRNPAQLTQPTPMTQAADQPATKPLVRVLLAEDNLINQKVAGAMLKRLGCVVDVAVNGREATAHANRAHYDLILMDCQMPEMDGFVATRLIRSGTGPCHRVPIIALTANAMQGDREICLAAGMSDYLAKPITQADLGHIIRRWLTPADSIFKPMTAAHPLDMLIRDIGDRTVVAAIVEGFLAQADHHHVLINGLTAANSKQDLDQIVGPAGAMGLEQLVIACASAEAEYRSGAKPDVDAIHHELDAALTTLREWLHH